MSGSVPSTGPAPTADVRGRVAAALARAGEVETALADPSTARDASRLQSLGREHARLAPVAAAGRRWLKLADDLAAARELADSLDEELADMARAEIAAIEPELARLEPELDELLTPQDPLDDRDAIVEIRAGTGGDEAALFAGDLFRMYTRFAERRGW